MTIQASALTVELVDGTQVMVPDSLEHITSYVLQEQGDWFEDEIKFLRRVISPGATIVDIGANYGVYALSLARKIGADGRIWAFEPATDTSGFLTESAGINGVNWLHVVQRALSDREGTAWLQKPGQSELNSLASSEAEGDAASVGPGEAVPVTTLDACLKEYGWTVVDLIKIDAEGEEERILQGGTRFFQEMSPLVMFEVKAGAEVHLDLVDRFGKLGYRCFQLVPGLSCLAPFDSNQRVDGYLLNLFAAKPDRLELLSAAGFLVENIGNCEQPPALNQTSSWISALEGQPYARDLISRWQAKSDEMGRSMLDQALKSWVTAIDCSQSVTSRYQALVHSYSLLQQICQPGCPATRWACLSRVALALGQRQQSVEAINTMLLSLQSGEEPGLDDPFLSPEQSFDLIDPAGRPEAWLEAAGLAGIELYSSYSGFYTGETARTRLDRIRFLGFTHELLERRRNVFLRRFDILQQQDKERSSVREWFNFLGLERPLRCIDVGALQLAGEKEPWIRWAEEGCAEVLGFEPIKDECDQINEQALATGAKLRCLPLGLGDGKVHTLHITNVPMTSSLFRPARSTVDLFQALGDLMQVVREECIKTHRLDDIEDAKSSDFLKLDVQGAELMIMEHGISVLEDVSVIQCEVEFVELYEGQPLQADVDAFLRSQGFLFHRFAYTAERALKPMMLTGDCNIAMSQMLWGDAIYIRDFRNIEDWSRHQLKAAAFLMHSLYGSFDLTHLILRELDRRQSSDLVNCYLMALAISN